MASTVALLVLVTLGHVVLRRGGRRLPGWLAARRGIDVGAGAAPWEGTIALACWVARMALWAALLRVLAGEYWILRGLRARLEGAVGMSVSAPVFALGARTYSIADVLTLSALLAALWVGLGLATRAVRAHVARFAGADRGVQDAVAVVVRYALSLLGSVVLVQAWGVDVSSLTIVASVLGVGLGFGLQNIASNFVSGLLLTLERPIKPGDFVRVGDLSGTVERIGARSTEIRTRDRVTILVPNAHLLEKEVVNWSHGDPRSRLHVPVAVAHGTDLRRARTALLEAARAHPEVLDDPWPAVELHAFGASGIELELLVWTRRPERQGGVRSDLGFAILEAFGRHGVAMPSTEQDVRLRAPVLEQAVTAWARRALSPRTRRPSGSPDRPVPALPDRAV